MTDFTVAFIGLPSSGKSSIINSLIGKRILESGICRTTTEYNLLDNIIEDDNNNKFQVMDLPGICDSEEHNINFNELTNKHITNANLIIWTSDVNKAFITTHEVNEYNRIKKILNDATNETGKLYYLIIMLSKCDKDIFFNNIIKKNKKTNEEISDSDEDTDINDLINKVHEKFSHEDIIYFNAFGRSLYNKKSTETLKKFIKKIGTQTRYNIEFNITKYIKNYDINQNITYYDIFKNKFILFKDSKFEISKLLEIWDNLTSENKNNFLEKLFEENPNPILSSNKYCKTYILNIFAFLSCEVIEKNHNIHYKLIYYYLYIHCNGLINDICRYSKKYSLNDLIANISYSFKLLNYSEQELFYNKILFDYSFNCDCDCRYLIINNLDWSLKNYYNFENMFNYYIDIYSQDHFYKFYCTIYKYLCNNKKYELKYDNAKSISSNFNDYLLLLDNIVNDHEYILLNKMEILSEIFHNRITNSFSSSNYYKLIKSYSIPYYRLESNYKWTDKNDKICKKIFSNLQVEYNVDFDLDEFKPISKLELLYDINTSQDNEKYKDMQ